MRILIANHHRTLLGGIETYLGALLPRLAAQGHELMFAHEAPADNQYEPIPLPAGVRTVDLQNGLDAALVKIRNWRPDIAYLHALHVPAFQRALVDEFPTALFAHGYYGLCISGSKTWKRAPARPCAKQFDWRCMLLFHAKSCGGSNPITMARDYLLHARQLKILRRCDAILTHGGQMQREYVGQGIPSDRVVALPHFVAPPTLAPAAHVLGATAKLLFIGRFDELKGGAVLIEALPQIAQKLNRSVELKMAGAGPAAEAWKRLAARIASDKVRVEFTGWVSGEDRDRLMAESDLLVVPSVWPEPFGQIGLEAAQLGLPAVAFDLGGISNWLRDGVSGHLAPANPPSAAGLAEAALKALGNPEHYARLRAGAERLAKEFSVEKHLEALNAVFQRIVRKTEI